jgi:hypothetical protein
VNYGTYLKQRYLSAIRTSVAADLENPHELFGMGGDHDVMVAGRLAVRDAVLERIPWKRSKFFGAGVVAISL